MAVEIARIDDAERPGRSIYTIASPTELQMQLAIENLMDGNCVSESRFSIPFFDKKQLLWLAYGTVERSITPKAANANVNFYHSWGE